MFFTGSVGREDIKTQNSRVPNLNLQNIRKKKAFHPHKDGRTGQKKKK